MITITMEYYERFKIVFHDAEKVKRRANGNDFEVADFHRTLMKEMSEEKQLSRTEGEQDGM